MKTVFKSKIGLELAIPIVLIFSIIFILSLKNLNWIGIITQLCVFASISHLFFTTKYTIENENLYIKFGFLIDKTIDIYTIKKITETNNLLSSPANSLDRLEIYYGKYESILISPKLKKEFIETLTSLNSNIEVKYKNK